MLFLKTFSWEKRSLWTLGDFAIFSEGKFVYLTKKWFGRNKICCEEDNYYYMNNMCEKEFSDLNSNQAVIGKILIFQEIAPNFKYSQKLYFLSIIWIFIRPTDSIL